MNEADRPKKEKGEQDILVFDLTGKNDWALHRRDKEMVAKMKAAESEIGRRERARELKEEQDADQARRPNPPPPP